MAPGRHKTMATQVGLHQEGATVLDRTAPESMLRGQSQQSKREGMHEVVEIFSSIVRSSMVYKKLYKKVYKKVYKECKKARLTIKIT